ncbi:hypothetical protein HYV49_02085 [Candidatus Pacearchaeota archaeon]|nr:hypothetical protein [Candidatus Pacearchaeota archaeon]
MEQWEKDSGKFKSDCRKSYPVPREEQRTEYCKICEKYYTPSEMFKSGICRDCDLDDYLNNYSED